MCKHKKVIFIGYQETLDNDPFPLYNCLECHSTITLNKPQGKKVHSLHSFQENRPLKKIRL